MGVKINLDKVHVHEFRIPELLEKYFYRIRIALLHRKAKAISNRYDYVISTYNEISCDKVSLQYVHHPMLASESLLQEFRLARNDRSFSNLLLDFYRLISDWVANRNLAEIPKNVTATNSKYIQSISISKNGNQRINLRTNQKPTT